MDTCSIYRTHQGLSLPRIPLVIHTSCVALRYTVPSAWSQIHFALTLICVGLLRTMHIYTGTLSSHDRCSLYVALRLRFASAHLRNGTFPVRWTEIENYKMSDAGSATGKSRHKTRVPIAPSFNALPLQCLRLTQHTPTHAPSRINNDMTCHSWSMQTRCRAVMLALQANTYAHTLEVMIAALQPAGVAIGKLVRMEIFQPYEGLV
jgi:hypothetical protein